MSNPVDHEPTQQPTPAPSTSSSSASGSAPTEPKRSFSVGQFLAGALFVLVVIFIAENTDDVRIRIIAGPKVSAPIWVALLGAAVVGALIGALLRARRKHNAKIKAKAKANS